MGVTRWRYLRDRVLSTLRRRQRRPGSARATDLHEGFGHPPALRDPDRPFDRTLRLMRFALGRRLGLPD